MKILYITSEGFDTPNPNNQMAEVMIRTFLEQGHSVHLVQSHRRGINPDIPKSLEGFSNLQVDTVRRTVIDKTKFVTRYLNDFAYAFQSMKYWRKVSDADVIYLQSYPTTIYPMCLLKLFKGKVPIVYSIYDVFPGHAHDIGVIRSKFLFEIFRYMQMPCYKMASAITVLSEDMKRKVIAQGAREEDVYVVPAWFDVSTTREVPPEENRFLQKYNIPTDKFYVQFAGTIGYVFDYKAVLELAKRLLPEKDIVIQIIGGGNVKDQFEKEAQQLQLTNIEFYPLQPVEIVPDVYSACSLCFIPLKKGVIGNGVPSKAPILMACKRAIVSSVELDSDYARMFARHNMGVAVEIGDYDRLASTIVDLYKDRALLREMAENGYRFGKENYSSTKSTAELIRILERYRNK